MDESHINKLEEHTIRLVMAELRNQFILNRSVLSL